MYAVVISYSGAGARQLIDVLEQHKADVEANLQRVTGLVSYTLLRSGDGGLSVTVCNDKAGADQSVKVAREWIEKNASDIHASAPTVTEGSVILQIQ
jgi:hypothetical protein